MKKYIYVVTFIFLIIVLSGCSNLPDEYKGEWLDLNDLSQSVIIKESENGYILKDDLGEHKAKYKGGKLIIENILDLPESIAIYNKEDDLLEIEYSKEKYSFIKKETLINSIDEFVIQFIPNAVKTIWEDGNTERLKPYLDDVSMDSLKGYLDGHEYNSKYEIYKTDVIVEEINYLSKELIVSVNYKEHVNMINIDGSTFIENNKAELEWKSDEKYKIYVSLDKGKIVVEGLELFYSYYEYVGSNGKWENYEPDYEVEKFFSRNDTIKNVEKVETNGDTEDNEYSENNDAVVSNVENADEVINFKDQLFEIMLLKYLNKGIADEITYGDITHIEEVFIWSKYLLSEDDYIKGNLGGNLELRKNFFDDRGLMSSYDGIYIDTLDDLGNFPNLKSIVFYVGGTMYIEENTKMSPMEVLSQINSLPNADKIEELYIMPGFNGAFDRKEYRNAKIPPLSNLSNLKILDLDNLEITDIQNL